MRTRVALILSKTADMLIRLFHLGSGSTWPGEIALRIDSLFIRTIMTTSKVKVVLVVGTNGKTTTSSMITYGLKKAGKTVIHNPEGANMANGVASALVRYATVQEKIKQDYAVFEIDESAFAYVLRDIPHPCAIVFLNLFRDQLDRYGEVHTIAGHWKEALIHIPPTTHLIVNADDPQLVFLSKDKQKHTTYFSASQSDKKQIKLGHDVDSVYCPNCGMKLTYDAISYSHLGVFHCVCGFKSPSIPQEEMKPLPGFVGVYNRYNMRAALITLSICLNQNLAASRMLLDDFKPAFGRQEHVHAFGQDWILLLSKNPAGFNQSIQALPELLHNKKTSIILVLNDRIPDGTDVSWIWDVELEDLVRHATQIITSGDRTFDMAIRMKYCFEKENSGLVQPNPSLESAIKMTAKKHKGNSPIVVLATYTGMLDTRKIVTGKKIL